MHILFVTYNHLDSNSGIHIFNLASQLTRQGIHVTVCVPDGKEKSSAVGIPNFETIDFSDVQYQRWSGAIENKGPIDIIHAWTPREGVRRMVTRLSEELNCPYIVHMEDNEEAIVVANTKLSIPELEQMSEAQLDEVVGQGMSYPKQYREFIRQARGVTAVIDKLLEFKPQDIPALVFWPGYEEDLKWSDPPDSHLRNQLGITADEYVLVYTGNVHAANVKEVFSLYLAVGLLNRRGTPVKLIRTGGDYVPLIDESYKIIRRFCINLGHVPRQKLPQVVGLADVLVQPGKADEFNEYRFPSKIPEYLASGRPVLLPPANIGKYLENDKECILLQTGNALEITRKLEDLLPNKNLQREIGLRGKEFAHKNLRWEINADKLRTFYEQIL